ncbi:UNVERIFIED_CONTAM: hypothetical protein HHA_254220 [Hammondia hammondi]|eukprot:XP_008885041.1 hypothetical protein HHA_254220 [Hammondia hammondi]
MDQLARTEGETAHNAEAKQGEEEDFDLYEGIDAADHLIAAPTSALPGASPSQAGEGLLISSCVAPDEERLVSFASLPDSVENEQEEDLVLLSGEIDLSLAAKTPRFPRTPATSAESPRIARVSSGLGRGNTFESGNLGKRKKNPTGLSFTRIEVPLFLGPPPAIPDLVPDAGGATTNSLLLLSQLSHWQSDISIREAAVQFGRVRAVRIFSNAFDGRSSGVGLLQFVSGEDAARAASQGLDQALQAKQHGSRHVKVTVVPSPIVEELHACNSVSWTGGGPIPDQLLRKLFHLAGQAMPPHDRSALAASFFSSHVELDGASTTAVDGARGGTATLAGLQQGEDVPAHGKAGQSANAGPGRGSADPLGAARSLFPWLDPKVLQVIQESVERRGSTRCRRSCDGSSSDEDGSSDEEEGDSLGRDSEKMANGVSGPPLRMKGKTGTRGEASSPSPASGSAGRPSASTMQGPQAPQRPPVCPSGTQVAGAAPLPPAPVSAPPSSSPFPSFPSSSFPSASFPASSFSSPFVPPPPPPPQAPGGVQHPPPPPPPSELASGVQQDVSASHASAAASSHNPFERQGAFLGSTATPSSSGSTQHSSGSAEHASSFSGFPAGSAPPSIVVLPSPPGASQPATPRPATKNASYVPPASSFPSSSFPPSFSASGSCASYAPEEPRRSGGVAMLRPAPRAQDDRQSRHEDFSFLSSSGQSEGPTPSSAFSSHSAEPAHGTYGSNAYPQSSYASFSASRAYAAQPPHPQGIAGETDRLCSRGGFAESGVSLAEADRRDAKTEAGAAGVAHLNRPSHPPAPQGAPHRAQAAAKVKRQRQF